MLNSHQILALQQVKGIGRKTVQKLVQAIGHTPEDLEELCETLESVEEEVSYYSAPSKEEIRDGYESSKQILSACKRHDIATIGITSPKFPSRLEKIEDPPTLLYGKGNTQSLDGENMIAVVGTREPSSEGKEAGLKAGRELARSKVTVVSGLAYGCDESAHVGCLNKDGTGVVVLAHGLDVVYPEENEWIAKDLLDYEGCLVSEYPPGTDPTRNSFVERDRIQSGLSDGVLVIETTSDGGTMHTVRSAEEQKRPIACVVPSDGIRERESVKGNLELIREDRATPVKVSSITAESLLEIFPTHSTWEPGGPRNEQDTESGIEENESDTSRSNSEPRQKDLFEDEIKSN